MVTLENVPINIRNQHPDSTFEMLDNGNYTIANSSYFAIVRPDGHVEELNAI